MSEILYGKPVADQIAEKIIEKTAELGEIKLATVGFSVPQWLQYTNSVKKSGEKLGILVENILCDGMNPKEFCAAIGDNSDRDDVNGVIVQQPLPKEYADEWPGLYLSLRKDLDCLDPFSVVRLYNGEQGFRPATPSAVLKLLDYYGFELRGKNVVLVGRGNAVGKPLALMMLQRDATVTICHTKTKNLPQICKNADIIVSACGCAGLINAECVSKNSVVIDVGLSFSQGKTCGDVSPEVYDIVRAYSPVPGGVGPVTRMTLFENLLVAATLPEQQ